MTSQIIYILQTLIMTSLYNVAGNDYETIGSSAGQLVATDQTVITFTVYSYRKVDGTISSFFILEESATGEQATSWNMQEAASMIEYALIPLTDDIRTHLPS